MTELAVRSGVKLAADPRRVIARPFVPGGENFPDGSSRIELILTRVAEMTEDEVTSTMRETTARFAGRHRDLGHVLEQSLAAVAAQHELPPALSAQRRRLIGAYFTHEYAIEAAALTNPSMVPAPDPGSSTGVSRFVMSVRAVGEGHISSILFRSGTIDADLAITLDDAPLHLEIGHVAPARYDRAFFETKLRDLDAHNDVTEAVLARLERRFTIAELDGSITELEQSGVDRSMAFETVRLLRWLASSNYTVSFPAGVELSSRALFPSGPTETRGMEDARLVRFVDDDGSIVYYATYTAFDGFEILPQLIETTDFATFRIATLSGQLAQNKGIALFPRRLGGRYAALARHDNVNNFLMFSDEVRVWRDSELIQEPRRPWELVQLGNCGSPIETEAGWLVITHGVGPFRQYAIGALLLDLDDPVRLVGHLPEPLLVPSEQERDGYVPNVVYSCGSMVHGDHVVVPYGFADRGAAVATVRLDDLLTRLTDQRT